MYDNVIYMVEEKWIVDGIRLERRQPRGIDTDEETYYFLVIGDHKIELPKYDLNAEFDKIFNWEKIKSNYEK